MTDVWVHKSPVTSGRRHTGSSAAVGPPNARVVGHFFAPSPKRIKNAAFLAGQSPSPEKGLVARAGHLAAHEEATKLVKPDSALVDGPKGARSGRRGEAYGSDDDGDAVNGTMALYTTPSPGVRRAEGVDDRVDGPRSRSVRAVVSEHDNAVGVVSPRTLPPRVGGRITGEVRVFVEQLDILPRYRAVLPNYLFVRLAWWGDRTPPTRFCPRDTREVMRFESSPTESVSNGVWFACKTTMADMQRYFYRMEFVTFEVCCYGSFLPKGVPYISYEGMPSNKGANDVVVLGVARVPTAGLSHTSPIGTRVKVVRPKHLTQGEQRPKRRRPDDGKSPNETIATLRMSLSIYDHDYEETPFMNCVRSGFTGYTRVLDPTRAPQSTHPVLHSKAYMRDLAKFAGDPLPFEIVEAMADADDDGSFPTKPSPLPGKRMESVQRSPNVDARIETAATRDENGDLVYDVDQYGSDVRQRVQDAQDAEKGGNDGDKALESSDARKKDGAASSKERVPGKPKLTDGPGRRTPAKPSQRSPGAVRGHAFESKRVRDSSRVNRELFPEDESTDSRRDLGVHSPERVGREPSAASKPRGGRGRRGSKGVAGRSAMYGNASAGHRRVRRRSQSSDRESIGMSGDEPSDGAGGSETDGGRRSGKSSTQRVRINDPADDSPRDDGPYGNVSTDVFGMLNGAIDLCTALGSALPVIGRPVTKSSQGGHLAGNVDGVHVEEPFTFERYSHNEAKTHSRAWAKAFGDDAHALRPPAEPDVSDLVRRLESMGQRPEDWKSIAGKAEDDSDNEQQDGNGPDARYPGVDVGDDAGAVARESAAVPMNVLTAHPGALLAHCREVVLRFSHCVMFFPVGLEADPSALKLSYDPRRWKADAPVFLQVEIIEPSSVTGVLPSDLRGAEEPGTNGQFGTRSEPRTVAYRVASSGGVRSMRELAHGETFLPLTGPAPDESLGFDPEGNHVFVLGTHIAVGVDALTKRKVMKAKLDDALGDEAAASGDDVTTADNSDHSAADGEDGDGVGLGGDVVPSNDGTKEAEEDSFLVEDLSSEDVLAQFIRWGGVNWKIKLIGCFALPSKPGGTSSVSSRRHVQPQSTANNVEFIEIASGTLSLGSAVSSPAEVCCMSCNLFATLAPKTQKRGRRSVYESGATVQQTLVGRLNLSACFKGSDGRDLADEFEKLQAEAYQHASAGMPPADEVRDDDVEDPAADDEGEAFATPAVDDVEELAHMIDELHGAVDAYEPEVADPASEEMTSFTVTASTVVESEDGAEVGEKDGGEGDAVESNIVDDQATDWNHNAENILEELDSLKKKAEQYVADIEATYGAAGLAVSAEDDSSVIYLGEPEDDVHEADLEGDDVVEGKEDVADVGQRDIITVADALEKLAEIDVSSSDASSTADSSTSSSSDGSGESTVIVTGEADGQASGLGGEDAPSASGDDIVLSEDSADCVEDGMYAESYQSGSDEGGERPVAPTEDAVVEQAVSAHSPPEGTPNDGVDVYDLLTGKCPPHWSMEMKSWSDAVGDETLFDIMVRNVRDMEATVKKLGTQHAVAPVRLSTGIQPGHASLCTSTVDQSYDSYASYVHGAPVERTRRRYAPQPRSVAAASLPIQRAVPETAVGSSVPKDDLSSVGLGQLVDDLVQAATAEANLAAEGITEPVNSDLSVTSLFVKCIDAVKRQSDGLAAADNDVRGTPSSLQGPAVAREPLPVPSGGGPAGGNSFGAQDTTADHLSVVSSVHHSVANQNVDTVPYAEHAQAAPIQARKAASDTRYAAETSTLSGKWDPTRSETTDEAAERVAAALKPMADRLAGQDRMPAVRSGAQRPVAPPTRDHSVPTPTGACSQGRSGTSRSLQEAVKLFQEARDGGWTRASSKRVQDGEDLLRNALSTFVPGRHRHDGPGSRMERLSGQVAAEAGLRRIQSILYSGR